ncbi:MAG TPA: zf-HC2 domain-containing protein [Jiangellaceae bacterium]|nr:zf-HC2 domain-containing protein [Jiangellaceae bacterium]
MTACDEIRLSLGALVLGALDHDEERRIREHVAGCPDCAAEVAVLESTAGLLAMAGPHGHEAEATASQGDPPDGPGPQLLDGLLGQVRAQRRRDRRRRWALSAAAAAAAAVVAGVGIVAFSDDEPAATDQVVAAAPTARVQGSEGGVVLDLDLWRRAWGTAVHVDVSGVPGGSRCSLVAVGVDGTREVAATWTVPRNGYDPVAGSLAVDGAVGMQVEQVSSYEVVTSTGEVLVVAR